MTHYQSTNRNYEVPNKCVPRHRHDCLDSLANQQRSSRKFVEASGEQYLFRKDSVLRRYVIQVLHTCHTYYMYEIDQDTSTESGDPIGGGRGIKFYNAHTRMALELSLWEALEDCCCTTGAATPKMDSTNWLEHGGMILHS